MKMRLFAVTIMLTSLTWGQSFQIDWQNTVGGAGADAFRAIFPTDDGGCVVAGGSFSNASGDKSEDAIGPFGQDDYWIVKLDNTGVIQWENTIGGDQRDVPWSIKQTADGGYILAGDSLSPVSGDKTEPAAIVDYWVVRLNASGEVQWENTIGGSGFDEDPAIIETNDGGFLVGGVSDSPISGDKTEASIGGDDFWLVKLESNGAVQWDRTIGGSSNDAITTIAATADGGYLLGGTSSSDISGDKTENSRGMADYWLVKVDANGMVQWDKTIGGDRSDVLESVYPLADGGFILGGYSSSSASGEKSENSIGGNDFWVVKLNASRQVVWENTIGGTQFEDLGYTFPTDDGGFMVIGHSDSGISGDKTEASQGTYDFWIVKLDRNGIVTGDKTIGGSEGDVTFFGEFAPSGDDLIIAGTSFSDTSGDKTEDNVGANDYWAVKLSGILNVDSFDLQAQVRLYPNPTSDQLHVNTDQILDTIEILSVKGQLIERYTDLDGTSQTLDVGHLSEGVYFLKLGSAGRQVTKKFVKN